MAFSFVRREPKRFRPSQSNLKSKAGKGTIKSHQKRENTENNAKTNKCKIIFRHSRSNLKFKAGEGNDKEATKKEIQKNKEQPNKCKKNLDLQFEIQGWEKRNSARV